MECPSSPHDFTYSCAYTLHATLFHLVLCAFVRRLIHSELYILVYCACRITPAVSKTKEKVDALGVAGKLVLPVVWTFPHLRPLSMFLDPQAKSEGPHKLSSRSKSISSLAFRLRLAVPQMSTGYGFPATVRQRVTSPSRAASKTPFEARPCSSFSSSIMAPSGTIDGIGGTGRSPRRQAVPLYSAHPSARDVQFMVQSFDGSCMRVRSTPNEGSSSYHDTSTSIRRTVWANRGYPYN